MVVHQGQTKSTAATVWQLSGLHCPGTSRRDFGRRLEFFLRLVPYLPWISQLLSRLRRTEMSGLFVAQPTLIEKIRRPYMDATWSTGQKAAVISSHYQWMHEHLAREEMLAMHSTQGLQLASFEPKPEQHYQLFLHVDRRFDKEGELVLSLHDQQQRIATMAFCVDARRKHPMLRIAGLQGGQHVSSEGIKKCTKDCHGLRPLALLFVAGQICAQAWGIPGVLTVSDQRHVMMAQLPFLRRKQPQRRQYDQLWQELGGAVHKGWYHFISTPSLRASSDVPSHKRAMYQRRYQMLDELAGQVTRELASFTKQRQLPMENTGSETLISA